MAADVNFTILSGRLVSDVQFKEIGQSTLVTGTVASNRTEKKDGEYKDVANFIDFQTWVKSPKQVEFYRTVFTKGSKVLLNGEMRQESWEKDGQKRSKIILDVSRIEPMGASKGGASNDAFPSFPE